MFQSNSRYYVKSTITATQGVWTTFLLSTDFELWANLETWTDTVSIVLKNWVQIERFEITATLWTATIVKRWITQGNPLATDVWLQKQWADWTIAYVTALAYDIIDKQWDTMEWPLTFQPLSTAERTALTPSNGSIVYDTDLWVLYQFIWGAWASFASWTTPFASATVAWKVEIATQWEVDAWTDTWGSWAIVSVIPSTFNTWITNKIASQSDALIGSSNTKLMTPLRGAEQIWQFSDTLVASELISYFWNGSDWDVTISTTVTLARDMQYNSLTITSAWILKPAGYKIWVKWALTIDAGGKIQRNGNSDGTAGANWQSGTYWAGGTGATALASGTIGAIDGWANGWNWWYNAGWVAGVSASARSPSYVNTTGASGWLWGQYSGWSGGGWGVCTRWALYNTFSTWQDVIRNFFHPASNIGTSMQLIPSSQYFWTWGGWGWGGWGSGDTSWGGGGGGGSGGNGGIILIFANTFDNQGTVEALWGNWKNWWDAYSWATYAWGGGGGAGWSWWVFILFYHTLTNLWTVTLTWGTGWTGGLKSWVSATNWSNGWDWTTWTSITVEIP